VVDNKGKYGKIIHSSSISYNLGDSWRVSWRGNNRQFEWLFELYNN